MSVTRTNWDEQEGPFLDALAEGVDLDHLTRFYPWAKAHGLDETTAIDMLEQLKSDGYIECRIDGAWQAPAVRINGLKLAPRGRRLTGLWPADDYQASRLTEELVRELERVVEDQSVDVDRRSKIRTVLAGIGDVGKDVIAQAIATAATRAAGLS